MNLKLVLHNACTFRLDSNSLYLGKGRCRRVLNTYAGASKVPGPRSMNFRLCGSPALCHGYSTRLFWHKSSHGQRVKKCLAMSQSHFPDKGQLWAGSGLQGSVLTLLSPSLGESEHPGAQRATWDPAPTYP